ncbi:MAG: DUF420 domain-containing protein [Pedosphaera sp.]|nr:DUF420 domain-containing protein [Pedosphaera sp.]
MSFSDLPLVNAFLNTTSAVCLIAGFRYIHQGNRAAHQRCMTGALAASILFLISYLTYHGHRAYYLNLGPTRFLEPAWFRPIYLAILISHTFLAVVIVPLVIMTFSRAVKGRFELHKKIARLTWPLWMYVSVTGVLIYVLLYQLFPQVTVR